MLKLLLLIAVLIGVYYLFFKKKKTLTPPSSHDSSGETMLPCTKCNTYVQAKEAFTKEGKYYCSRECMED
jgi:uncharacterized protein